MTLILLQTLYYSTDIIIYDRQTLRETLVGRHAATHRKLNMKQTYVCSHDCIYNIIML